MKLTKKFLNKVDATNVIIRKALEDDVYAIETDSTWEEMYIFEPIYIKDRGAEYGAIKLIWKEVSSGKIIKESLSNDIEANDALTWILKCIKKGYRWDIQQQKLLEKEDK